MMVVSCSQKEKAGYSPTHCDLAVYGRYNRSIEIRGTLSPSLNVNNKILQSSNLIYRDSDFRDLIRPIDVVMVR